MPKSNAMSLIAHPKILDDIALGNSFMKSNMNSNDLWSNFSIKKKFHPKKKGGMIFF